MTPSPDAGTALRRMAFAHGDLAWREAGDGPPLVLLHGIGAGSGSWAGQLAGLAATHRVLAWDAPGYGGSAPLPEDRPMAPAYAQVLAEWLEGLGVTEPLVVGHSLGAIVAAAFAARHDVSGLVLASPARGYGGLAPAQRETKYRERADLVARLGIAGMAAQRSAALCAPGASAAAIEQVRVNMARATPGGYLQAAYLLSEDDLMTHLRAVSAPVHVLCGELDGVTLPAACAAVAREVGAPFTLLRGVAHACYVEDPAQFNAALMAWPGASLRAPPTQRGDGHG